MKNPLRKRYLRELKSDFGKYLVIFLFMVMLISIVSGYLVAASSIKKTFYEGFDKYNVEDGHITFSKEPTEEVLSQLEDKGDLKFNKLSYIEEDLDSNGATVRIFKKRDKVNLECLMEGEYPTADNEIAVDRVFAETQGLNVGDAISFGGKSLKICGFVALVDYGCLFENNSDMMLSASTFGVGIMSESGFNALGGAVNYNYAWKYNTAPKDESEEDAKSEAFIDDIEDVVKAYDTEIIQAKVNELYENAKTLSNKLEDEFDDASDVIEDKIEDAGTALVGKVMTSLTEADIVELYLSDADGEDYLKRAAENQDTTMNALLAEELSTTETALDEFEDAFEKIEDNDESTSFDDEPPTVNLNDTDDSYDNDIDFDLSDIRNAVEKLEATGLYDTSGMTKTLDSLEEIINYNFDKSEYLSVENYVAKYQNKAITYCMDDMEGDKPTFLVFDYIVTVIIAFVFAVTVSNTIVKESGVIGTLRALGFTKKELVKHYLFMPTFVTLIAAVVGNILGYTWFVGYMKEIFYRSFSLAAYESLFNAEAFVDTTVLPIILMILINLLVLNSKLKLSPIKFLRYDLSKKKNRKAFKLSHKMPFFSRFRLRILFQNIPAYLTLFIGVLFGCIICVFGFMFGPLLEDYSKLIISEKLSDYQYVLIEEKETETNSAEKYAVTSLDSMVEGYVTDEISIYGITDNSEYITADIPDGEVLVSVGIANKFKLGVGDTLTLKDPYKDKTYSFKIGGTYDYYAAMSVFMNIDEFNSTFGENADHFSGYFSNEEIKDIDSDYIATVITDADLTKVSDQMMNSVGSFMNVYKGFGAIMLVLLMFLMTKQVIEKNMQSIAMTKILGFRNGEIAKLYLIITSFVVIASLLISVPIVDQALRFMFDSVLYTEMSGYIPYIVSNVCYIKCVALGIICYAVVCAVMMIKIGKIKKSEALKNVE